MEAQKKLIGNELPIFSINFRKFYLSISISWRSLSSLGIIPRFIKESGHNIVQNN